MFYAFQFIIRELKWRFSSKKGYDNPYIEVIHQHKFSILNAIITLIYNIFTQ